MATIRLNREQRDAIYGELVAELAGTGDIRVEFDGGNFEAARRLRRHYEANMRLLDDLGWEPDQDGDEFEITMDNDQAFRQVGYRPDWEFADASKGFEVRRRR